MRPKSMPSKDGSEAVVCGIRRHTSKQHLAVAKIRIVLSGLRGEASIAEPHGRVTIGTQPPPAVRG